MSILVVQIILAVALMILHLISTNNPLKEEDGYMPF